MRTEMHVDLLLKVSLKLSDLYENQNGATIFCKILWHQNAMKILSAVLEFFRATTQMGQKRARAKRLNIWQIC